MRMCGVCACVLVLNTLCNVPVSVGLDQWYCIYKTANTQILYSLTCGKLSALWGSYFCLEVVSRTMIRSYGLCLNGHNFSRIWDATRACVCLNCCLHNRVVDFRLSCVTVRTCVCCQFHCCSKIGISALNEHLLFSLLTRKLDNHSGVWVWVWVGVGVWVCECECECVCVCVCACARFMYTSFNLTTVNRIKCWLFVWTLWAYT